MSEPNLTPDVTSREAIVAVLEANGPLPSSEIVPRVRQIDGVSAKKTSIRLKLSEMHKRGEVRPTAGTERTGYVYKLPEEGDEL